MTDKLEGGAGLAENEVAGLKEMLAEAESVAAGLRLEIEAANSAQATLQDELAAARQANAALEVEKAALASERDGLKDMVAKLRKEANVSKKAKPAKVRAAGPLKDGNADAATMLELLNSEAHEIVFSDGKKEIAALAPLRVGGKSWAKGPSGVVMTEPVKIRPDRAVELAGFALFDEKGEQLGWCAMPRPMQIGPGQEVKLDRQIVF